MQSILIAIKYMHDQQIAHRDIKLENIICSKDDLKDIKIIDFGFATNPPLTRFCGTPSYVSPDVINSPEEYDTKCDIWSLGVVFYSCVTGTFPFNGDTIEEKLTNISSGKLSSSRKMWSGVSPECEDLIRKMLKVKASERISAKDALEHPWFDKQITSDSLSTVID